MHKDELLKRLTILDFMAMDLSLYLDSYPNDCNGIKLYNKIADTSKSLRKTYESQYGPLIQCSATNVSDTEWLWASDPWPWEKEFNFSL